MNKSEIAARAAEFYEKNATNVINVPRPGHPEDKSGWDGVRRASQAKFIAQDALVMTLPDAIDFAAKFVERAIAESQAPKWISVEEKLPDDEHAWFLVYATRANGDKIMDKMYWFAVDGFGDLEDQSFAEKPRITHWMPLPAPPKGTDNV